MKKILICLCTIKVLLLCFILLVLLSLIKKTLWQEWSQRRALKRNVTSDEFISIQRPLWVVPYITCTRTIDKILKKIMEELGFSKTAGRISPTLRRSTLFVHVAKIFWILSLMVFLKFGNNCLLKKNAFLWLLLNIPKAY